MNAQDLQFKLVGISSIPNAEATIAWLEKNRPLWIGFVCMHEPSVMELVPLRDIAAGSWNCATILISASPENAAILKRLAREIRPDEYYILDAGETCKALGSYPAGVSILRLWWD